MSTATLGTLSLIVNVFFIVIGAYIAIVLAILLHNLNKIVRHKVNSLKD